MCSHHLIFPYLKENSCHFSSPLLKITLNKNLNSKHKHLSYVKETLINKRKIYASRNRGCGVNIACKWFKCDTEDRIVLEVLVKVGANTSNNSFYDKYNLNMVRGCLFVCLIL